MLMAALVAMVSAGCSTTRRVEKGEILYNGLKGVVYENPMAEELPEGLRDDINDAVDVPGNKKTLMVLPLGLWVYNNMGSHDKGLKKWFYNKFAQEPVVVSEIRPEIRTKMIDEILDNNGYFRGTSSYQLVSGKNKRKAKIEYTVNAGKPYLLDSIQLLPDTCCLSHAIDSLARREAYLRPGQRYSTDSLQAVRTRITNSLRNRGYYFFRPEFIEYLADSTMNPGNIALRMTLASNVPPIARQLYRTGNVTMYVFRNAGGGHADTVEMSRGTLIQMMPSRLRRQLMDECVTFKRGKMFSVRDMDRTQSYLARLGIFNSITISALPDTLAVDPTIDVAISCTFDMPLETSIEANVSSKSNSYLGPGVTLGLTNRNVFGGGEQLSVNLTGSYEWQTGHGSSSVFNSYEVGITGALSFPRFIAPKFIPRRKYASNWTRVSLSADLLNRPHYFKMAQFNAAFSYDWMSSRFVNNNLTLFKLTYTNLLHTTSEFDSITAANPAIALSFRSQFIPQMSYTYSYDRTFRKKNTVRYTISLTEAGNVFWSIYELCGQKGEKRLFKTPFSQFIKGTAQVVYGRQLGGRQSLWTRAAVGAAHAYGNATEVPYTEQFYCGGANSVRAFTVRSIGPGSYRAPSNVVNGYFDQTGTFKFEFNVEYRFPIFGPLYGATFFDSGNVWLLKNDPQRPGGELKGSKFFKELATGTGVGLRLDISMLVIRADLGIGIHAPYDTGKHGYYNMENFRKSMAFHLAIGYPF
ncbi:MAG: BamA/TamA family outer membrane protein [Barnesiella sp.]|nr:BamA/TamA family outer membrane protein [Barnesiella sp.]